MLWASSYMVLHNGISKDAAASYASLFFIGITAGRAASGFLTLKFTDRQMIRGGQILIALGITTMLLPFGNNVTVVGLILTGLGCAPIYPCIIHSTPQYFGADKSQALIGVQMASAYTGTCLMPPLFGLIANHISAALFPVYLAALLVLMIFMHESLVKKTREAKKLEVVYSPLCEANGAFIGKLRNWLSDTDVEIELIPFNQYRARNSTVPLKENCFIDIYYNGKKIDSVPLHKAIIYDALGIHRTEDSTEAISNAKSQAEMSESDFWTSLMAGEIRFSPITRENYKEELSMCLHNYPFGNPPAQYHDACIHIKQQVFSEIWSLEDIAGIYATYQNQVIGLLEIMPREILKKYGYMTGTKGNDVDYLSTGCYEIGRGIPRTAMIDALQNQLTNYYPMFRRKIIEGIGIYGWRDGFNPYWVYEKYGYTRAEELTSQTIVMEKRIM